MQLMQGVIPSLQTLSREGEYGRNKLNQYTRVLAVPMALLSSYGFLALLASQGVLTTTFSLSNWETVTQIITLSAGSILLMFLGELITEKGIGNGISFIIFAGIVGRIPAAIGRFFDVAGPGRHRDLRAHRPGRDLRDRVHPGGPAADPHPVREPRPRPAPVLGRLHVPAPAGQPGRRDPDHLRDQHPAVPDPARGVLPDEHDRARRGHLAGHRGLPRPARRAVPDPVLRADRRVHLLLHGVHVQTRRDRRAITEERRLHPGHPARATDPGVPGQGRLPDHDRGRAVPGHRGRSRRRSSRRSCRPSAGSAWAAPACSSS